MGRLGPVSFIVDRPENYPAVASGCQNDAPQGRADPARIKPNLKRKLSESTIFSGAKVRLAVLEYGVLHSCSKQPGASLDDLEIGT